MENRLIEESTEYARRIRCNSHVKVEEICGGVLA